MDFSIILGFVIGIGGILLGHAMDGGHVSSLVQATAGVIVFGGTFGAVLVATSGKTVRESLSLLMMTTFRPREQREAIAKEIVEAALTARKESILSLEKRLSTFSDPFMRQVFRFVVDGVDPSTIKELFENEIYQEENKQFAAARVFTEAGGYAPTIGIIGAVLGLIHVMENLTDTSKLGTGIAIAFVATVYGVGSANLIFLPLGVKAKRRAQERSKTKEMILMGALSILNGLNPYIIEEKMKSYFENSKDLGS